jgi:hypothetical protein
MAWNLSRELSVISGLHPTRGGFFFIEPPLSRGSRFEDVRTTAASSTGMKGS